VNADSKSVATKASRSGQAADRIDPAYDLLRFEETDIPRSLAARFMEAAWINPGAALRAGTAAMTRRTMRAGNIIRAVTGAGLQRAGAAVCEAASRISRSAVAGEPPKAFSIAYLVMAEADTPEVHAAVLRTVASFRAQEWSGAYLWIATGDRRLSSGLLAALANEPARILTYFRGNAGIATLTQEIAALCASDLLVRLDAGDALQPLTSRALAMAVQRSPGAEAFYSDEALTNAAGRFLPPLLKPPFCADYLMAINYTGPFLAVRHAAFIEHRGLVSELGKAAWSDLLLRIAHEKSDGAITHIAEPLVVRTVPDSFPRIPHETAERQLQARQQVAARHIARVKRAGEAQINPATGVVETIWALPKSPPLISVIVPTRDRADLLRVCMQGLLTGTDYPALEILIVDNASKTADALQLLAQLAKKPDVRVLRDTGEFNHSRMNNLAALEARGELLIMLNNDIEIIDGTWASRLASYALRPETGAVGALLYYPDGKVQHGGIVTGIKGTAGHAHQFFKPEHPGYMHRLRAPHEISAVTGACLCVSAKKYQQAGGLDEVNFPISFNDVDFCLTLRSMGHRNMMVPAARLIHHESATRKSSQKRESIRTEAERLIAKWGTALASDPFYGPKFNHGAADFSLEMSLTRTRK